MDISNLNFITGKFDQVVEKIIGRVLNKKSSIILPCSLYDLATAWKNPLTLSHYKKIDIITTDGMPLVWLYRWRTKTPVERVYGPDLTKIVLTKTQGHKQRHFFIGVSDKVLNKFEKKVRDLAPDINIIGKLKFNDSRFFDFPIEKNPTIIWIGIGSPKQIEIAMELRNKVPTSSIFCIGAAMELIAKIKPSAPSWMKNSGFEWLFRLISEPKRLWRRYLVEIPSFLTYFALKVVHERLFR